jgi:hypothetical protein
MNRVLLVVSCCCLSLLLTSVPAAAQGRQGAPPPPPPPSGQETFPAMLPPTQTQQAPQANSGRLLITVVDQLGAVIPNAKVTVTGVETATMARAIAPASTTDKGIATIEGVLPGRYTIRAEFAGFGAGLVKETRVRSGENKVGVVLPLKGFEDSVTVGRDKQEAGADRTLAFGSALTREQIEMLADDPDEMRRQLMEMAGPDAVIKVDSFEGQQLPPKAQIKSIRISRDQFAAENHGAYSSIDIVTQAGIGPLRTSFRTGFSDSALDGRNPLVQARGPAQNRSFGGTMSGTLIKNKMDLNVSLNGTSSYSTPQLYAGSASGQTIAQNLNLRAPSNNVGINANLNYALTKDQTLRVGFNSGRSERDNILGQTDYAERAYSSSSRNHAIRISEIGPLGRRFFTSTRFSLNWSDTESESASEGVAYVILDNFTTGGAQRTGGTHSRMFIFQSDLDYVRGKHSFRVGVQMDGGRYRNDSSVNYLGTYTFESADAFNAGRPRSFTRRLGDPTVAYWNVQTAFFVQDDFRPRKNLSISYGLRYEGQTHVQDRMNFAPRGGFTWSPFKSGRTTLRGSAGVFYDWFLMGTYSQVLQTDGTRQQEVNILNPTFPDPGAIVPASTPTNRYLLDPDLLLPRTNRFSLGVSQSLLTRLNMGASYSYNRVAGLLVGENLNTPVNGVRPNPLFSNLIRATSDAASRYHSLSVNASVNLGRLGPGAGGGGPVMAMMMERGPIGPTGPAAPKFFDWRRGLYLSLYPSLNFADNNTDGAFAVPATGDLSSEWGASGSRGFMQMSLSSSMVRNLSISLSLFQQGVSPLTIRTGLDDNRDLIFNDRPAGVGRGTERVPGMTSSSLYLNYNFGLGKATTTTPGGVMITSMGGVGGVTTAQMGAMTQPRYRINVSVSIQNPTNRANLTGYSGVMTSPFFLKPTNADGVRRINFNVGLSF